MRRGYRYLSLDRALSPAAFALLTYHVHSALCNPRLQTSHSEHIDRFVRRTRPVGMSLPKTRCRLVELSTLTPVSTYQRGRRIRTSAACHIRSCLTKAFPTGKPHPVSSPADMFHSMPYRPHTAIDETYKPSCIQPPRFVKVGRHPTTCAKLDTWKHR